MTRKHLLIVSGICLLQVSALILQPSWAAPRIETITVKLTGADVYAGTNTSSALAGYIEDMQVTCSDGSSTGVVAVVVQPKSAQAATYSIATGTASSGAKLWRTSIDRTGVDGSALTSDPPGRVCLIGDTVSFQITASQASNVTWRLDIKLNDN